jgi:hypothetical protein
MGMPPLESKGPPPEARTEAPPRTGKPQVERKLADEAQTRAFRKPEYTCMLVCVCVCGIQAPQFKASAASREDVPPPHNMSGSRESFISRQRGTCSQKKKQKDVFKKQKHSNAIQNHVECTREEELCPPISRTKERQFSWGKKKQIRAGDNYRRPNASAHGVLLPKFHC